MKVFLSVRQKFLSYFDRWMISLGVHVAEIGTEMLATGQARSNSRQPKLGTQVTVNVLINAQVVY